MTSEYILGGFGETSNVAIPNFQSFVNAGIGIEEELDFKRGGDEGILGDDDFVKQVREKGKLIPEVNLSIHELTEAVCDLYDTNIDSVRISGKGRRASKVRVILAILVRESGHLTLEELAKGGAAGRETIQMVFLRLKIPAYAPIAQDARASFVIKARLYVEEKVHTAKGFDPSEADQ